MSRIKRGPGSTKHRSWTERGGFSSYGKTALLASFKGDATVKLLQKIEQAGKSVDEACKKAINATLPGINRNMKKGAERHRDTGEVVDAIEVTEAKQEGDYIYGSVGINLDKHPEAFEAVFQECGDGHSPQFPDPFVRVAAERKEITSIIKKALKKEGVL